MKKIKINYEEILNKMYLINEMFFFDLLIELYPFEEIKKLCVKHNLLDPRNSYDKIYDFLLLVGYSVFKKKNKSILDEIIKHNDYCVKRNNFDKMTYEELENDFKIEITYHEKFKASSEMIIFFYLSKNIYKNDIYLKSLEFYENKLLKIQNDFEKKELKEINDILVSFRSKLDEVEKEEIEFFLKKDYDFSLEGIKKIEEEFQCIYNQSTDKFDNVNADFLTYIFKKFSNIKKLKNELEQCVAVAYNMCKQAYQNIELANKYIKQFSKLKEKIRDLEIKNRRLKKDSISIKKIEKSKSNKETKELEKENYYLKSEIEKLQERIAILEEEEKLNKEIKDNIEIQKTELKKIKIQELQDIAILGGKWNSKNSEEIENFFWNNGNSEVEFLEADKLIRNEYKIKNADIVIFDTSYNSHTMFAKYRKNIDFIISKSNITSIEKLFEVSKKV